MIKPNEDGGTNTKRPPRGIRNNNPGNIEYKPKTKWQGLANPPTDGRFCIFTSPTYGIRALARVLITYQDKSNIRTISGVIKRWAPDHENNTVAYINAVSKACGVGPDDQIDLQTFDHLKPLVEAIIRHENGQCPYSDAQITKALVLAGVEPKPKPLSQSRTVKSAQLTTASVVASGVTDGVTKTLVEAQGQLEPLIPYADSLKWVFIALALAGILWGVWARIDDRNKGLR
jgi:hypothetical protein